MKLYNKKPSDKVLYFLINIAQNKIINTINHLIKLRNIYISEENLEKGLTVDQIIQFFFLIGFGIWFR